MKYAHRNSNHPVVSSCFLMIRGSGEYEDVMRRIKNDCERGACVSLNGKFPPNGILGRLSDYLL